jgi:hypothetical protein
LFSSAINGSAREHPMEKKKKEISSSNPNPMFMLLALCSFLSLLFIIIPQFSSYFVL